MPRPGGAIERRDRRAGFNLLVGGESAGIRTLDLLIKSQLLYRLSYALPCGFCAASRSARNICR